MKHFRNLADLAGRVLLGATFLYWGIRQLLETLAVDFGIGTPPASGGYERYMEAHGVPYELLPLVLLTEIGGGLMLVLGWRTPIAAIGLAGFCLLANLFFHMDFSIHANVVIFIKNIALAGGLLVIAANEPGDWSLAARRRGAKP